MSGAKAPRPPDARPEHRVGTASPQRSPGPFFAGHAPVSIFVHAMPAVAVVILYKFSGVLHLGFILCNQAGNQPLNPRGLYAAMLPRKIASAQRGSIPLPIPSASPPLCALQLLYPPCYSSQGITLKVEFWLFLASSAVCGLSHVQHMNSRPA